MKNYYEEYKQYKEGFHILMEYWECLPEDERTHVDTLLKAVGL